MTIKANTCPYCGAAYTIAARGCIDQCPDSQRVAQLIRDAIDADIREDDEPRR